MCKLMKTLKLYSSAYVKKIMKLSITTGCIERNNALRVHTTFVLFFFFVVFFLFLFFVVVVLFLFFFCCCCCFVFVVVFVFFLFCFFVFVFVFCLFFFCSFGGGSRESGCVALLSLDEISTSYIHTRLRGFVILG